MVTQRNDSPPIRREPLSTRPWDRKHAVSSPRQRRMGITHRFLDYQKHPGYLMSKNLQKEQNNAGKRNSHSNLTNNALPQSA